MRRLRELCGGHRQLSAWRAGTAGTVRVGSAVAVPHERRGPCEPDLRPGLPTVGRYIQRRLP